jgi:diacylglycerol O-acyltransferase
MRQLSGMDAGFLYGETPEWHMHAGALIVVEPPGPEWSAVEALKDVFRARIDALGPFKHRLAEAPLRLAPPVWLDTPRIDLDLHIHRVALAAPGDEHELGRLVGDLLEAKLDRRQPLWEIYVIEGLADGRVALLIKIHHSLVDGVRGAALYEVLFDLAPDAERPAEDWPAENEKAPSLGWMAWHTARSLATMPVRFARLGADLVVGAGRALRFTRGAESSGLLLPFRAPGTPLNQPLTPRRTFAFSSVPLADMKAVKREFGVTVNDVALAMVGGALREYLQARDELPDRPLVAQIPVGVHRGSGPAEGNFVAATGATLGTDIEDPVERLLAIHESTCAAKGLQSALGDDLIAHALRTVPPALLSAAVGLYRRSGLERVLPPVFTAIVSNVPGPTVPLYTAGARLVASYAIGPLLMGSGLNVTFVSYLDRVDFGVVACPDVVDDPWAIAEALPAALADLVKRVG